MQTRRAKLGCEMMLLPPMGSFIPEDHLLRRLDRVLDLAFVHEAVKDRYCADNGRPSVDPEVVIRLFLIQAIDGIRSVRDLMRQVQVNLAYRWFIGYELTEDLPDHSTLSRALDRFGDDVFTTLFQRSVAQCQASGLIEGRVLHLDTTTIRADLDRERVGQVDSPDPDARYGKFPGKHLAPGYKQQTLADNGSRVIVGVSVMPANRTDDTRMAEIVDEAVERLGNSPEAVCADAAYGNGRNRAAMESRGVRLASPPRKPITYTGHDYFTTEDFDYHETQDEFTCPAGATLRYIGPMKGRPNQRRYRALNTVCRVCPLKPRCTTAPHRTVKVSVHHAALVRLRADSRTKSFQQLYRARSHVIEGIFAEGKQWHRLGRAWRRGLSNMFIQCHLIAAVLNFKRLMAAGSPISRLMLALVDLLSTIRSVMRCGWSNESKFVPPMIASRLCT